MITKHNEQPNPHYGQNAAVLLSRTYVFAAFGGCWPGVAFLIWHTKSGLTDSPLYIRQPHNLTIPISMPAAAARLPHRYPPSSVASEPRPAPFDPAADPLPFYFLSSLFVFVNAEHRSNFILTTLPYHANGTANSYHWAVTPSLLWQCNIFNPSTPAALSKS